MNTALVVLAGTFLSTTWLIPAAMAQPACVTQNMAVPPGANTTDKAAPFFIDTTGLDGDDVVERLVDAVERARCSTRS